MKNFDLNDLSKAKENARKQIEIAAKAAADAEVARVSRVSKHIDRDDLDDVWQEAYDRTLRLEMDAFEAELDALEEEEYDKRRLGEYFSEKAMREDDFEDSFNGLPVDDNEWGDDPPIPIDPNHVCHDCQSRPCRCEEFARRAQNRALLEKALMDDLIADDYEEEDYNNSCSTCHNWPCVCGARQQDGM